MKKASSTQSDHIIEHATVRVEGLYAHPWNYNRHPEGQIKALRKSLRTSGQVRSIVVQRNGDGHLIVAGEGIVTAARAEGMETLRADVIPADWPPQRVTAYLAADNELARESEPERSRRFPIAQLNRRGRVLSVTDDQFSQVSNQEILRALRAE